MYCVRVVHGDYYHTISFHLGKRYMVIFESGHEKAFGSVLMNAHLKTLLNVSGIAKRNGDHSLVRAGKVSANTLMSPLVCPLNHALRPFYIRTSSQKLVRRLWWYALSLCHDPASIMPL
jgi:hypothetical protein